MMKIKLFMICLFTLTTLNACDSNFDTKMKMAETQAYFLVYSYGCATPVSNTYVLQNKSSKSPTNNTNKPSEHTCEKLNNSNDLDIYMLEVSFNENLSKIPKKIKNQIINDLNPDNLYSEKDILTPATQCRNYNKCKEYYNNEKILIYTKSEIDKDRNETKSDQLKLVSLNNVNTYLNHELGNYKLNLKQTDGELSGNSAGLISALYAYIASDEKRSKAFKAAGITVAGTGAISVTGEISSIAGVELKTEAADRIKADIMFIPKKEILKNSSLYTNNCSDAENHYKKINNEGKMEIICVDNFKEVIDKLNEKLSLKNPFLTL